MYVDPEPLCGAPGVEFRFIRIYEHEIVDGYEGWICCKFAYSTSTALLRPLVEDELEI